MIITKIYNVIFILTKLVIRILNGNATSIRLRLLTDGRITFV